MTLFNASKVFYCTPLKSGQNNVGVEKGHINNIKFILSNIMSGVLIMKNSYTSRCVKFSNSGLGWNWHSQRADSSHYVIHV